jgi:hypothetical protein
LDCSQRVATDLLATIACLVPPRKHNQRVATDKIAFNECQKPQGLNLMASATDNIACSRINPYRYAIAGHLRIRIQQGTFTGAHLVRNGTQCQIQGCQCVLRVTGAFYWRGRVQPLAAPTNAAIFLLSFAPFVSMPLDTSTQNACVWRNATGTVTVQEL